VKILYVSQYYSPEVGAAAARVSELAGAWVQSGHEVTVLTAFPQHPVGEKAPQDRGVFFRREKDGKVELLRCYIWATPNAGNFKRMFMFLSFALSAAILGRKAARPDVVVATSPQLLTGLTGWYLARKFKVPFVFEVRDLWPESIIAVKAMEENLIIRGLKKLSAFLYCHSRLIVTVGEGYKRRLMELYGVRDKKIFVIPNGVETKLWKTGPRHNALRRKLGWDNDFVVLYLGTIGMAHALHRLVQAAGILKHRPDIRIVIVGEGAEKKNIRELIKDRGLRNIQVLDSVHKEKVPLYYSACDLGVVHLRDTPLFKEVLPSKVFEYLAMERPIISAVGGDTNRLVEDSGGGVGIEPEDPEQLAKTILKLSRQRARLTRMGKRGRQYVLRHFNRTVLAEKYVAKLREISEPGKNSKGQASR
jgi:glycosyltransferase involved in cell wall biosynthesis